MVNPGSHKKTLIAATWDATNYRPTTNVGCPGDSGGPYTDSSGNIFGLVSAGTSNRTAPTDRPANPVLHRGFITRMNAAYGNGVVCDTCQKVGFKTFDNVHFLQAVDNGGGSVVATPTQLQEWETFRIVPMGQTFFPLAALQTGKGNWVTAEGGGGANVVANRTLLGSWETFFVTNDGNGVALATISSSKFMTAEGAGGGAVNANRTQAKEWESFVPVVVANALPD
jgi:hypothetical protein